MCILDPFYFKWGSFQPETVMDINMKGGEFDPQTKEEIGNSFGKDKSITNGKVSEHFLMFWYGCFFLHILFSIFSNFSLAFSWVPFFGCSMWTQKRWVQVEKQGSENLAQLEVGGAEEQIQEFFGREFMISSASHILDTWELTYYDIPKITITSNQCNFWSKKGSMKQFLSWPHIAPITWN